MMTDNNEWLDVAAVSAEDYECEISEADVYYSILEYAPNFPSHGSLQEMETWTWEFVQSFKRRIVLNKDRNEPVWSPDEVKKCFMFVLGKEKVKYANRKILVHVYDRAVGCGIFPSDWTCEAVRSHVNDFTNIRPIPRLDTNVFRNRSGYAPCYPYLLAAIYLAGIYSDSFPFAMKRYGDLFGCNQGMVWRLFKLLIAKHIIVKIKQGKFVMPSPDGSHRKGASSWYRLIEPEALLDLFLFQSDDDRDDFEQKLGSYKNQFVSNDWGEYVIYWDWLKENNLLGYNPKV